MSAPTQPPQIITRALTFSFAPSVNAATGLPEILEVALIPLGDESSEQAGATFAGGLKTETVELASPGPNVVVFDLIPSYSPGLTAPILYRVMWRAGVMGRTYTSDFAMPDEDLDWEALVSLGGIIDGEVYLQHSDLGVPGRVCRLNDQGIPTDADGNPVATGDEIALLQGSLSVEAVTRASADSTMFTTLNSEIQTQNAANLNTAKVYTDNRVSNVSGGLASEVSERVAADTNLQNQINAQAQVAQDRYNALTTTDAEHGSALNYKADLVSGKIPITQIPDGALTSAVPVADQTAMLALPANVVQKGDLAVRPDGIWFLNGNDPSVLGNWFGLTNINSVNGQRGVVVLTASDVNAIPVGGSVALNQVTGLSTALSGKTDVATTAALQTQVTNLATDPTTVHTVAGTIPDALMPADIALVNSAGQVTNKTGSIVASGSGTGGSVLSVNSKTGNVVLNLNDVSGSGSIAQSQVTGLPTALTAKVDTTDARMTNARTPTAHAASHASGGTDALTLAQSQIVGLPAIIGNNALTSSSNAVNRIGSLETRVTTVEGGGGTGGGGAANTTVFYESANTSTRVIDFTQVFMHSPWGIDSDGTIAGAVGSPYYLHSGVRDADVAYPTVSPNGHLHLYRWNEAGAADPTYALASDLSAINATVATKANQSALTTLSATVDTKAAQADLTALTTTVGTKADASALATTNSQVSSKANQSDVTALTTTVSGKADSSALTTLAGRVTTVETALPAKADLVSGTVPVAQVPTLPESKITNLTTDLAAKAPLVGGVVPVANIPTGIPQASISGLPTSLNNKADLVGGTIPVAQIPPEAITNAVQVANRAAMLALSTTQVQKGDFCTITGSSDPDKGTYLLTVADPSVFSNWQLLGGSGGGSGGAVASVNGYTGAVVLTYTDVGAMAANATLPISQVTGLQTQLNTFATTTSVNSGLATKTAFSDVQNMFYTSSMVKRADYVATAAVASLAGQQSADGVVMPVGAVVLLTAQPSSVNNGLWVVAGGTTTWSRPADFATGSWLARDSIVIVSNQTASANGTANPYTVWQMTVASGYVDTALSTWTRVGWVSPPVAPVQGNGIAISGTYPALTIAAKPDSTLVNGLNKGIVATSAGLGVDPNTVCRKFVGPVPPGSTVAAITHNLNTTRPGVSIWDTGSNTLVLAGVTATSANAISIEFVSAPASGQYQAFVWG